MYEGIVSTISGIEPIKGADRIVRADVAVNGTNIASVVTGIETSIGAKGIYFGADIQLGLEYCEANNLIAKYDENGEKTNTGYFDEKRKVKAQRFKGVRSEGLWMPLSSLDYLNNPLLVNNLIDGALISTINDQIIAQRYPKPIPVANVGSGSKSIQLDYFPEHSSTPQLIHYLPDIERIPLGADVIITEKLHGTSERDGYVLVDEIKTREATRDLNTWERFVNWFLKNITNWHDSDDYYKGTVTEEYVDKVFKIVHGTRRTVVDPNKHNGYYGSNQFRIDVVGEPNLQENEMLYGEIVGYIGDKLIMPQHDATKLKDVRKAYGDNVTYSYGCNPGECAYYIYRITNYNGVKEIDMPWKGVVERATELGYKVVPVLETFVWDGNVTELVSKVKRLAESEGSYSKSVVGNHISEGVVVRFEKDGNVWLYKYKSEAFRVMEGITDVPTIEDES